MCSQVWSVLERSSQFDNFSESAGILMGFRYPKAFHGADPRCFVITCLTRYLATTLFSCAQQCLVSLDTLVFSKQRSV